MIYDLTRTVALALCLIVGLGYSVSTAAIRSGNDQDQTANETAVAKPSDTSKALRQVLLPLLQQESYEAPQLAEAVKNPLVAGAMLDLYRELATKVEPDCADIFDVKNEYTMATLAVEPYGKINSTGFDPATNGDRPITNRDIKDKVAQRVLENIQDTLGEFHPGPFQSALIPGLTFEFQESMSQTDQFGRKHSAYICLIKPAKSK
jgi:hypothetical protein